MMLVCNTEHVRAQLLGDAGAILLQREIPEAVNLEVAKVLLITWVIT